MFAMSFNEAVTALTGAVLSTLMLVVASAPHVPLA